MSVVMCGSMSASPEMGRIREELAGRNVSCLAPPLDSHEEWTDASAGRRVALKREACERHFALVAAPTTDAVLLVNVAKGGRDNYIGPNAFAEAGVAFASGKAIYLLHDFYAPFRDELEAWGAVPLRGDLSGLGRIGLTS